MIILNYIVVLIGSNKVQSEVAKERKTKILTTKPDIKKK